MTGTLPGLYSDAIKRALRLRPGSTTSELARFCNLTRYMVDRELQPLIRNGEVFKRARDARHYITERNEHVRDPAYYVRNRPSRAARRDV